MSTHLLLKRYSATATTYHLHMKSFNYKKVYQFERTTTQDIYLLGFLTTIVNF